MFIRSQEVACYTQSAQQKRKLRPKGQLIPVNPFTQVQRSMEEEFGPMLTDRKCNEMLEVVFGPFSNEDASDRRARKGTE